MKRLFIIIGLLACSWIMACAQSKCSSEPQSFHITRDGLPPVLDVVPGSVQFADNDKNNVINAGEENAITMVIKNSGAGDANGCIARVRATGSIHGLMYEDVPLPNIAHGKQHKLNIPVKASHDIETGEVHFIIEIDEPHGMGIEPISIDILTQEFLPPCVEVVSHQVLTENQAILTKKQLFTLRLVVQNTQQGLAEDIKVDFNVPKDILLTSANPVIMIPSLLPNESDTLDYDLISTVNAAEDISFEIALSEKYGKYAHNKKVDLHFGQKTGIQTNYTIHGNVHKDVEIKRVSLISAVDENIPVSNTTNNSTYVLIIANENYEYLSQVNHAINDGVIFRQYCLNTLGIPDDQIFFYKNATSGKLLDGISRMKYALNNFSGAKAIVYYCGHGIPDEKSGQAYLIPTDGKGTNTTTCYNLNALYTSLASTNALSITYFMDACYTGADREGGMLIAARSVARAPEKVTLSGNTIVFSASSGDETAMPLHKEGHGLFTYYLLKKLQETKGNVSYGELADYINKNVKNDAFHINEKPQTPVVATSPAVVNTWRTMKLK